MDIVTELERLSDLYRSGDLSDDEYVAAKAAVLTARLDAGGGARPADDVGRSVRDDIGTGGAGDRDDDPSDGDWAELDGDAALDDEAFGADRPRGGGAGWVLGGLATALIGLYIIGSAVVAGSSARSMIDAQSQVVSSWGTFGDVTITDANGRPISVSPRTSPLQPVHDAMSASIGQAAGLQALFGIALLGLGGWQLARGTERRGAGGVHLRFGPGPSTGRAVGHTPDGHVTLDSGPMADRLFGSGPGSLD